MRHQGWSNTSNIQFKAKVFRAYAFYTSAIDNSMQFEYHHSLESQWTGRFEWPIDSLYSTNVHTALEKAHESIVDGQAPVSLPKKREWWSGASKQTTASSNKEPFPRPKSQWYHSLTSCSRSDWWTQHHREHDLYLFRQRVSHMGPQLIGCAFQIPTFASSSRRKRLKAKTVQDNDDVLLL